MSMFCILGAIFACPVLPSAYYIGGRGEMQYAAQYPAQYAYQYAIYAVPLQQQVPVFPITIFKRG